MPKLALIKHSLPDVRPGAPPSSWPLSVEGRRRCQPLAMRLRPLELDRVFASREPKATETGRLLADALGLPFEVREGLHEHEREREPFAPADEFGSRMRRLFERPNERVYGDESAQQALTRFSRAVDAAVAETPDQDLAIVAHGTVISLFSASRAAVDGFGLWQRLGLPSYVVLDSARWSLLEVVDMVSET
jgi:broad specificity phosphatase PhoE